MRKFLFFISFILVFNSHAQNELKICSFNIQFLGHFKNKENKIMARFLEPYDIVVIQEMVAPPVKGKYLDKSLYKKDLESALFVNEMLSRGFSLWLSTEDTGPTKNHSASPASEWWIIFYKNNKIKADSSRFYGFISSPLSANPSYERVPFAFPFQSVNEKTTFTLIPVHLKPGNRKEDQLRRQEELNSIFNWTASQKEKNKDFIVLGDFNIYKKEEFLHFEKDKIYSLNKACLPTNTKLYETLKKGKPYDHVFYNNSTKEDIKENSFKVVDIRRELMQMNPSNVVMPYDHKSFRTRYSDHLPISFELLLNKDSD
ncbi:MAG: hypothetical protein P8I93_07335 [Crocinitomicaceae bacterium]|nr:hypothetical protein [Crocinitomicaceae bacterium]